MSTPLQVGTDNCEFYAHEAAARNLIGAQGADYFWRRGRLSAPPRSIQWEGLHKAFPLVPISDGT